MNFLCTVPSLIVQSHVTIKYATNSSDLVIFTFVYCQSRDLGIIELSLSCHITIFTLMASFRGLYGHMALNNYWRHVIIITICLNKFMFFIYCLLFSSYKEFTSLIFNEWNCCKQLRLDIFNSFCCHYTSSVAWIHYRVP